MYWFSWIILFISYHNHRHHTQLTPAGTSSPTHGRLDESFSGMLGMVKNLYNTIKCEAQDEWTSSIKKQKIYSSPHFFSYDAMIKPRLWSSKQNINLYSLNRCASQFEVGVFVVQFSLLLLVLICYKKVRLCTINRPKKAEILYCCDSYDGGKGINIWTCIYS